MARDTDKEFSKGMKRLKDTTAAAKRLKGLYESSNKSSKPKSKSVTPKVVNKSVKVSQAQIDQIKKLGMTKALAMVKANKGSVRQGAVEITNEAVRRLYGQDRFDKAMGRAKRPAGATPKQGKAKSNFSYSAPVASKKPAKKPMTPYQKDMARRGIYGV